MALNFETQRNYENPEIDIRPDLLNLEKEVTNWKTDTQETTHDGVLESGENTEIEEAKQIIEQWWDIREIKRLTPELAKELVEKKLGSSSLDLYKLKTLDAETAKELVKFKWVINFDWWYQNRWQWLESGEYEKRCQQIYGQLFVSAIQKEIETSFKDEMWSIEYIANWDSEMIKSYWKIVEFRTNRFTRWQKSFDCNGDFSHKSPFILKWLNYSFSMNEWLWLANFKNRIKDTYWNEKVEYKMDIINKSFGVEKTLCVWNKTLLSRWNLEKRLDPFHRSNLRHEDKFMEDLVDWLNK